MTVFPASGWLRFKASPEVTGWIAHARPIADAIAHDPQHANWLRHGGTWFVGVNLLPNDASGAVDGGPPLQGEAMDFLRRYTTPAPVALEPGQVSVCYHGYPQASADESEAAFRFRRDRDAAHLDGLMAEGLAKRRFLRESHAFVLGIPLVEVSAGMAPFVIWEGSHEIIRTAFSRAFAGIDPARWHEVDVTEIYQTARREIFSSCTRVEVLTKPGEVYAVHRMALHGMAPWTAAHTGARPVIYFRPELAHMETWLSAP